MTLYRGGWPYANPPNTQFTLNTESPQAKGLVGWWTPLIHRGGGEIKDLSGRGHHGTIQSGVTSEIDPDIGPIYRYDNATDYIQIADHDDFTANPYLTVCVWCRSDDTAGTENIFTKGAASNYEWALRRVGDYMDGITWTLAGSTHLNANSSAIRISAGQLTHWVFTLDVNAPEMRVFQDGIYRGNDTTTSATPYANGTAPVRIAIRGDNSGPYGGTVGDVRIYNQVLTDNDIARLFSPDTRWDLYQPVIPWALPISLAAPPTPPDDKLPDKIRIARTYQIPIHQLQL